MTITTTIKKCLKCGSDDIVPAHRGDDVPVEYLADSWCHHCDEFHYHDGKQWRHVDEAAARAPYR